jgi:peptide/nickel transport system substrate-binding protein
LVVDESQSEPTGLDVAWDTDNTAYEIIQNIYQGLIWYQGNSTINYVGVLATSWTVSPDGLTYVFSLRKDVLFSNGDPFSAYDVWFNLYRATLLNGPPAYIVGPILFQPGSVTVQDLNTFDFNNPTPQQLAVMQAPNQSIQVVDQYTVAFHLEKPIGSFLARLAAPPGGMMDPTFIQQNGGTQGNSTSNDYILAHGAPGTAPYVVNSWIHGQSITLTLNPHYWGPTPHVSKVVLQYKGSVIDAINDLKTGAAQMTYFVPFNLIDQVQNTPGVVLESYQGKSSYCLNYMPLDTTRYPLNITNVRHAIDLAINKSAMVQNILSGFGTEYQGPMPRGMFGYDNSIPPTPYDPAQAEQLLAQAGFPGGKGIRPLSLMYQTGDPVVQAEVQAIQSDLAAIGIKVNLQAVTLTTLVSITVLPPGAPEPANFPDMNIVEYTPDFGYPDDYAYNFLNVNGGDFARLNDTLLNRWTYDAIYEPSQTMQAQLYDNITLRTTELSPFVWMWQYQVGLGAPAYSSSVQNVYWNPILYGFNYSAIYIQPT